LRGQFDFWVGHDPLLFGTDLHEGKLLDEVILSIINDDSSSGTIDSNGSADQISAGLSFQIFGGPDAVNRSNRKVAIDNRTSIDWVISHKVLSLISERVELWLFLRSISENYSRRGQMLSHDVIGCQVNIRLYFAEFIFRLDQMY